ncbi:MAG: hypothetical protein WA191_26390 [Telluria sp.]
MIPKRIFLLEVIGSGGSFLGCARFFARLLFYRTSMYTKIVVIVNDDFSVDKSRKPKPTKELRQFEVLGQSLYRAGTVVGQKSGCGEKRYFFTSHPVDIQ